ncbi:MAG: MarR family transcriptional regulator [Chloroflexi bacterium]|nr:MarR family transcriptional regulator [Chloroflexota bacterium]
MNGLELFLLGRTLTKLGEQAMPRGGFRELPASVWTILLDVLEHPNSSISEIAARTGFPQSHVSASVARLRAVSGALETVADPKDGRRTLVRATAEAPRHTTEVAQSPADRAVAAALGTDDPQAVGEVMAALELLARHLTPQVVARLRSTLAPE